MDDLLDRYFSMIYLFFCNITNIKCIVITIWRPLIPKEFPKTSLNRQKAVTSMKQRIIPLCPGYSFRSMKLTFYEATNKAKKLEAIMIAIVTQPLQKKQTTKINI